MSFYSLLLFFNQLRIALNPGPCAGDCMFITFNILALQLLFLIFLTCSTVADCKQ